MAVLELNERQLEIIKRLLYSTVKTNDNVKYKDELSIFPSKNYVNTVVANSDDTNVHQETKSFQEKYKRKDDSLSSKYGWQHSDLIESIDTKGKINITTTSIPNYGKNKRFDYLVEELIDNKKLLERQPYAARDERNRPVSGDKNIVYRIKPDYLTFRKLFAYFLMVNKNDFKYFELSDYFAQAVRNGYFALFVMSYYTLIENSDDTLKKNIIIINTEYPDSTKYQKDFKKILQNISNNYVVSNKDAKLFEDNVYYFKLFEASTQVFSKIDTKLLSRIYLDMLYLVETNPEIFELMMFKPQEFINNTKEMDCLMDILSIKGMLRPTLLNNLITLSGAIRHTMTNKEGDIQNIKKYQYLACISLIECMALVTPSISTHRDLLKSKNEKTFRFANQKVITDKIDNYYKNKMEALDGKKPKK
jgi:hypothetical protein